MDDDDSTADIVAKGMTKAAGVEVTDAEGVEEVVQKLETEREADKTLLESMAEKKNEIQDFLTGYTSVYGEKPELQTLFETTASEYEELIKSLSSEARVKKSTEFIAEKGKAFYAKALKLAKATDPNLTEDGMKQAAAEAIAKALRAKEGPPIPAVQRRMAESVLANLKNPNTKTPFNAGKVIGDKAPNYAMSNSDGYVINTHVEETEGTDEALLVMDYTGATFDQAFDSAAAFKKYYPTLDLPEGGDGPFKMTEDVYLSESRPRPFKGERRMRDLNVTVERDDQGNITKVNVTVSNIQFGTPPNSAVHIRLGKKMSELSDVRDILYPSDEYKNNRFGDSQGQSAEVGAERISDENLAKYRESIAKLAKIDINDPELADMPEFLRDGIKPHLEKIRELEDLDDTALRTELMNIQIGYDSIFQMITGDVPAGITGFPAYKEYKTYFNPEKGLKYGEGGYEANIFDDHFGAAGTRLRNHFFETDAMGGGRHEFVGINSANFVFRGHGDAKSVSGVFVLKLKSDPSVTTRFEFTNIDGSTWDQIMLKAVDQMTRDKQVNKDLGHTTFRKNLRERNGDVKDAERIRARREKVADREKQNMSARAEYVENRSADRPAFDPFTVPDYQARSEEALLSKIAMDYGEFNDATHQPVDYVIEERGGKWYAVNKSEPSLQDYSIRQTIAEVHSREMEKQADRADAYRYALSMDESFDPFSMPDYRAVSRPELVAKIKADHGDVNDYKIEQGLYSYAENDDDLDGHHENLWVAVNKSESTPTGAPAGPDEGSEEAIAASIDGSVTTKYLQYEHPVQELSKENYGRYFAKLTQLYVKDLKTKYPDLNLSEDLDYVGDVNALDKTRITGHFGDKYVMINIKRAYAGQRVSDFNIADGAEIGVRFGREVGKPDGNGDRKVTYDVGHPYVDLDSAFSAITSELGVTTTSVDEEVDTAV